MGTPLGYWIGFNVGVIVLLVLDLAVLSRGNRAPGWRRSLLTTAGWVALALGFGAWLAAVKGGDAGTQFFTGYVIEYSLSVDNLFLFVLIFTNFEVPPVQQRRLLSWGVTGALIMRALMIVAGVALLQRFDWLIYIFGAYIVYAGIHMLLPQGESDVEQMTIVRFARRWLPVSSGAGGGRFFVRENGRWHCTLLFLVLLVIEATDLVFALDSIPAIFGVTRDAFIVYTSNACAVLGLRSLYFVLAGAVQSLAYLHFGLAAVLIFIGGKMLGDHFIHVPTPLSLVIVAVILAVAVAASLLKPKRDHAHS
jgi:tellurite resistance protein TerC